MTSWNSHTYPQSLFTTYYTECIISPNHVADAQYTHVLNELRGASAETRSGK